MGMTLREARKRWNWTVETLADKSGIGRSTLYRLESGDTPSPSYATVIALEQALRLKRGTLVFGAEALRAAS